MHHSLYCANIWLVRILLHHVSCTQGSLILPEVLLVHVRLHSFAENAEDVKAQEETVQKFIDISM